MLSNLWMRFTRITSYHGTLSLSEAPDLINSSGDASVIRATPFESVVDEPRRAEGRNNDRKRFQSTGPAGPDTESCKAERRASGEDTSLDLATGAAFASSDAV
jgi:hypothetical protein